MAKNVEDPWTPLKDLASVVEAAILRNQPGILNDLENTLKKHKPTFIGLLKNPPRSSADAALVRKATTEGISFDNDPGSKQKLPASMVEEAMIISEMFEMNEISSLQLLLQAEEQLCQYPGLTRGLVAVLLYYDGRKAVVQALRTLIQGRKGVSWTLGASEDITDLITKYTSSLLEDGLVDKILNFLKNNDWTKEVNLLQKNLALGNAKHRRQVFDLFTDIRQGLAECLFAYSAQSGLPKQDVFRLFDFMSKVKNTEGTGSGNLDDVNMTLTMALLYALDATAISKGSDGEEILQSLPLLNDSTFIPSVHRKVTTYTQRWEHLGLQSLIQFAWSMTLATLRSSAGCLDDEQQTVVEDDESVLDNALENGAFHWLLTSFLQSKMLKTEEFYVRRFHQLLTDLIALMPLKVKELRNRADESARNKMMHEQEGVQFTVPLSGQHFENLLNALGQLYKFDKYGLILDFWSSNDNVERLPQRQVSLNKFIRLAGDLLMPSLYTPYVNLLVSLSAHPDASLHCFNLLKMNGGQTGGGCSTVSWDHFFASLHQYFANLRQEAQMQMPNVMMDSIYRRPMTKGISPGEVQGLAAVLKLITEVTKWSEAARIAISDHSTWQPGLVMVGLLSCAVPTGLKAEILKALAALGQTSEIAFAIWQNIEAGQLINTIPSTSQQRPLGLFSEIEEIEARNEEYPLTRAFLRLIDGLTDHGLPENLGQGTRIPGFRPYFNFVRDHIFHKFSTRAYKNAAERWDIGKLSLKIMLKLLKDYVPNVQEFNSGGGSMGFHIMTHLLQSSETLRLLLFLLDEGMNLLESHQDFRGKEEMEDCLLNILKLLDSGLKLQHPMLEASRQSSNTNLILTALSNLLLAVNPRSGKPDHMLNVVKFVIHSWRLPSHGLHAIEVIRGVGKSSPMAQSSLLATFRITEITANTIIKGFADVLDNDEEEYLENPQDININDIRIAAIDLLLDGLEMPGPTLTHFLLGFNLSKGISKSQIQSQGVLGSVRSPFHAILGLLRPLPTGEMSLAFERTPNLAVASLKLIYHLCSNMATSEVTLRFLRSSEDFLVTQSQLLPFQGSQKSKTQLNRAMAWLLKTVAIEAKILCQTRQRSQLVKLAEFYLETQNGAKSGQNLDVSFLSQLSRAHNPAKKSQNQHRLLSILESIDFSEENLRQPQYEIFDTNQVQQVLRQCQVSNMIDVKTLHKILNQELANLQNSSSNGLGSQRSLIQDEIKIILKYAMEWNSVQDKISSRKNLLDAWRQVGEMLLCALPNEQILAGSKQRLILELLQMLLNKVLSDGALLEMTNQVSGVVLLLMTALRQTYEGQGKAKMEANETHVSILDEGRSKLEASKLYSSALQAILKGLVMWIVGTSAAAQRVRANLYGALLNYLRIGKVAVVEKNSDEEKLKKANLEVLLGYGDAFLDIVCRDSVSGHEIRMMLALSLLDELVCLEGRGSWLYYLSKQGYLRHIIESLASEDNNLNDLVNSRPVDHLKLLYVYETKMALLTRLASTATGSEMLLESGVLVKFAEMSVFSSRPEIGNFERELQQSEELIPSALSRYQQIIFPVLKLCQAILAALGSENVSSAAQVLHFVTSHECIVRVGLHYSNLFTLSGLQELSLLTGVISRSVLTAENNPENPDLHSHLSRIQRQMISLLAHFGSSEDLIKKIASGNLFHEENRDKALKSVLEIQANCLVYAVSTMGKGKNCRIILMPNLSEAIPDYNQDQAHHGGRSMSLGHLVLLIQHVMNRLSLTRANLRDLKDKLKSVHHLSSKEMASFLHESKLNKTSTPMDQRNLVQESIEKSIGNKQHELEIVVDSMENAAFVLWRHLDHFVNSNQSKNRLEFSDPVVKSRRSDQGFFGSYEAIERLKKETRSCFNDALFRKLDGIEATFEEDKRGTFFSTINRRLKRIATLYT